MAGFVKISRAIDRLNTALGSVVAWLVLAMVLIGAYNAAVRYLGRHLERSLSSNAYIELQWYLFSLVFLLGAACTLKRNEHVRVDVLYGRLSARSRAWIDLVGTLVFLLPFCAAVIRVSLPSILHSWEVREVSPDPGGLPRYPIKSVIPVSFALLFLQGVSEAIKRVAFLRGVAVERPADGESR